MRIHVVERGDTLWQLARMYDTTINQIALVNRLANQNVLTIGESLVIPIPNTDYVVEPGDTFANIAQRFNVTVQELAEANNISNPDLIFVGRMLYIPYFYYQINSGDTLYEIARKHGVTVEELTAANQLSEDTIIYPGQVIKIPNPTKEKIEVNAYTTDLNEQGRGEVLALGSYFTYLTPFSYGVREDGSISELNDALVLEAAFMTNTSPLLVLTNFRNGTFISDLAASILRNPDVQITLINNILAKIEEKGYQGLNIDFEYVYP